MGRILYTADIQVRHAYCAKLRGFTRTDPETGKVIGDIETHDEMIVDRWNRQVRKDDRVFLLGDYAMNWDDKAEEILSRLKGEIILIIGNHDLMSPHHRDGWKYIPKWIGPGKFASITTTARRKVGDLQMLMSHYPYQGDHEDTGERFAQYRLRDEGEWLLHGHLHVKDKLTGRPYMLPPLFNQGKMLWRGKQVHVGTDAWDYAPVHEEQVVELIRDTEFRFGLDRTVKGGNDGPHA